MSDDEEKFGIRDVLQRVADDVATLRARTHDQNSSFSRMEGVVTGLVQEIRRDRTSVDGRMSHHNDRIASVEKTNNRIVGAVILLGALFPVTVAAIVGVLALVR